jgi:hypothetical protein
MPVVLLVSAKVPLTVLEPPVVLLKRRAVSAGGVGEARGVITERIDSAGAVGAARGVILKRACPKTGVALRRSNARQRQRENERSNKNREERSSVQRMARHIKPPDLRHSTSRRPSIIDTLKSQPASAKHET